MRYFLTSLRTVTGCDVWPGSFLHSFSLVFPTGTGAVPCAPAESRSVQLADLGLRRDLQWERDHGPHRGSVLIPASPGRVSPTGACQGSPLFLLRVF